jgi:hypothetical protein
MGAATEKTKAKRSMEHGLWGWNVMPGSVFDQVSFSISLFPIASALFCAGNFGKYPFAY